MSEPSFKRRRTNSPAERPSIPLKQPPRRPSFASPTKSSLARDYPNLLHSSPTKAQHPGRNSRGDITNNENETGKRKASQVENGTPSAQRKGRKGELADVQPLDEEELSSTPLQGALQEQDASHRGTLHSSPSRNPLRIKSATTRSPLKPRGAPAPPNTTAEPTNKGGDENRGQNMMPGRLSPNPEIEERKREKARLEREVEELEYQIKKCTEEIKKEQGRARNQVLGRAEQIDLVQFIVNISGVTVEEERPAPVSSLLCSFLPFSNLIAPPMAQENLSKPVLSHRPVELQHPLPLLEMFTSLDFATQVSLSDSGDSEIVERTHQKHIIDVSGPDKLLMGQIILVINTISHEITEMRIARLSQWAERELGTHMRHKAETQDLSNATWAMGSYWGIAQKRAQFWHHCYISFPHLLSGQGDDDAFNIVPQTQITQSISRKDLNRFFGCDTISLQDKNVLLKVNWQISFDWTGEAQSEMSVECAFPQVWNEAEGAESLQKIPEAFSSLLRSKGAFESTRIMVALLFTR